MAMKTLSESVSHFFEVNVRNRGWEYIRGKRILVQQGNRFYCRGLAFGSAEYRVAIRLDGNQLHMFCGCEAFRKNGPCKHLWAMIVEAERVGHLSEVMWAPRLALQEDQSADEASGEAPIRPGWRAYLRDIDSRSGNIPAGDAGNGADEIKVLYFVDPQDALKSGRGVSLHLSEQRRNRKNGEWTRTQPLRLTRLELAMLPDAVDRELLLLLSGSRGLSPGALNIPGGDEIASTYELAPALAERVLPQICGTGRCFVRGHAAEDRQLTSPLAWDPEPYRFRLLWQQAVDSSWQISAEFVRGDEMLAIDSSLQLIAGTFLLRKGAIGPLSDPVAIPWIQFFRLHGQVSIPGAEIDEFLREVLRRLPEDILHLPLALRYQHVEGEPRPALKLRQAQRRAPEQDPFTGKLEFLYEGGVSAPPSTTTTTIFHPTERKLIRRDAAREQASIQYLEDSGFRPVQYVGEEEGSWDVSPSKLVPALRKLYQAGWYIELQGLPVRSSSRLNAKVTTGIDWFELTGEMQFDEFSVPLPELLKAMSQGETMFQLEDGSMAILGEEQIGRLRSLLQLAELEKEGLRFSKNQVGLLDALLAAEPDITADETLNHARRELQNFRGIPAAEQPPGLVGELREYQREGLGWLLFLQQFRFGGCLADDMGVGKTAQVLALLETRRAARAAGESIHPSLVVAPRSLIFNWQREAARFTPELRTLDFSGLGRSLEDLQNYDVILTTYGTLRRDIAELRKITFDYAILDEAQAIKNFGSASSKAARLVRANHRLTMTGTPVENHLGELWSLFEFLNPGMLGKASLLKLSGAGSRTVAPETRELLSAGLRPFLLRRTKEQVAKELPAKMEQTLFCELDPAERKLYNELRDHYRTALLSGGVRNWGQSKMQVLEALLRLRQAACHAGLLDKKRTRESSAKLDTLLSQLDEVLQEGHKALIFSQFTSLLALVRQQLDAQQLTYEYLDGKTRDRQTPVERFQSDPECKIFLISLKAGGTGLNLTAADYVFLLDPWWNPAVEAQAIDRAHRIGQDKPVFAYRLIAKDTVEERVLELQNSKRELASAILSQDNAMIANLQPEDLEMLLS